MGLDDHLVCPSLIQGGPVGSNPEHGLSANLTSRLINELVFLNDKPVLVLDGGLVGG